MAWRSLPLFLSHVTRSHVIHGRRMRRTTRSQSLWFPYYYVRSWPNEDVIIKLPKYLRVRCTHCTLSVSLCCIPLAFPFCAVNVVRLCIVGEMLLFTGSPGYVDTGYVRKVLNGVYWIIWIVQLIELRLKLIKVAFNYTFNHINPFFRTFPDQCIP